MYVIAQSQRRQKGRLTHEKTNVGRRQLFSLVRNHLRFYVCGGIVRISDAIYGVSFSLSCVFNICTDTTYTLVEIEPVIAGLAEGARAGY